MWRLVQYREFEGSNILKMLSSGRAGKAIMPVVFTCMLDGNVSEVEKRRYSFKEEYAISQTPQVVLDHHVRDDLGYLKVSWDYIIDVFDKQYITDIFGTYVNNIKKFMEKIRKDKNMFVKEFEITLENGMKISGELDSPERQGQWKTIILFHGSGPSDRHATVESMGRIVSHNFDLLSEGFVKAGYAVFRYEKKEIMILKKLFNMPER